MHCLQFCNFSFALIFAILSTSGFTLADDVPNPDNSIQLCTSQICEEAGSEIVTSIDHSVEPCDDFYKHACGGWIAKHPIPEELEAASQPNVIVMKSQAQLKEMLQKNETSEIETFRKVKDYYRSCVDLAAIDARGLNPLQSLVSANGDWPLTLPSNDWSLETKNLTFQKIHENYAKVAIGPSLYTFGVLPDLLNSSVRLLQLGVPLVPLLRQRFILPEKNTRNVQSSAYINYTEAVATELARLRGLNVPLDNIKDDVVKMLEFEAALTELTRKSEDKIDNATNYRVTTIAEVQNTWNTAISGHPEYAIDWLQTIRSSFEGTDIVIEATERIGLMQGNIVEKLADLLKKYPLRTVVNYVHWYAIDSLVPYTNKKMRDITNVLIKNLYGYEDHDDQRSVFCIGQHNMLEGMSYLYVRTYFGEPLTTAIDIVSQIKAQIKRQFDQSTWMDDEAKLRSKEKVDNMVTNIGYPSWYDEPGKIDEFYSQLAVGPNYFENFMNYNRFNTLTSLKKLREPYDRYNAEWPYSPILVSAVYVETDNSITFPAVNFQMPIYHAERPLVMNYGSIGFLVGHEISHGFHTTGGMYDMSGNLKKWWSDSTIAKYDEKEKCFVDQYNKYPLVENYMNGTINVDGEKTLAENIGDNTGAAVALKAFLSYKKSHNDGDIKIPALRNYTDEKLFFYSFSNYFCASQRPESVVNSRHTAYSPNSVRVNGVVSNMPAFSEAFNCPSGKPMNPVKKCGLWN